CTAMRNGACSEKLSKFEIAAAFRCCIVHTRNEHGQFGLGFPVCRVVFRKNGVSEVLAEIEQFPDFGDYLAAVETLCSFKLVDFFMAEFGLLGKALQCLCHNTRPVLRF